MDPVPDTRGKKRLGRLLALVLLLVLAGVAVRSGPDLLFAGLYRATMLQVTTDEDGVVVTEWGEKRWPRLPGPDGCGRTVPESRIATFFPEGHRALPHFLQDVGRDSAWRGDLEIEVPSGVVRVRGSWWVIEFDRTLLDTLPADPEAIEVGPVKLLPNQE